MRLSLLERRESGLHRRLVLFFSFSILLIYCNFVEAQPKNMLVIYPEIRAPFSKVFDDIATGAEKGFDGKTSFTVIREGESVIELLNQKKPDVILALGQRCIDSLDTLDKTTQEFSVVVGAVSSENNNYPGISIVPDTKIILENLMLLAPSTSKIHVVTKPSESIAQLDSAEKYLTAQGKKLIIHTSSDLREAASVYKQLVAAASQGDAIWILQDGSFVNTAILSLLLDAAWSKNLVVFSSNPVHVKHGALFAVYPDNKNMGVSLGKLANQVLTGKSSSKMQALQDTLLAVNERTSNHLGITLSRDMKDSVDLLLPAR